MGPQHHGEPPQDPVVRQRSTYLTDAEATTLCTIFGDGLDSGMSYARIIDMLERQGYDGKVVAALRSSILEQGYSLADAFLENGLLDETARTLIDVAERQGQLPTTFKELGHYFSQRHQRRKNLVSSMAEPCLLVALGLILARNILGGDLEALAESTDIVANLKPLFIQSALEVGIFACVVVFIGYAYLNLPVEMKLRSLLHRVWIGLPLPLINAAGRLYSLSSFFHYTRQSISSGLTVHQALELAARASNNPSIQSRIAITRQSIEEGLMLAESLRKSRAVPDEAIDYIEVGEESGRLEERLQELATRYEEQARQTFDTTLRVFVYLLRLTVVVLVIGGLMLSVGEILQGGLSL